MRPVIHKADIKDITFGQDVQVVHPVNLYKCKIGDQCLIGPFVEIQKNLRIGKKTRIQSHSMGVKVLKKEKNE